MTSNGHVNTAPNVPARLVEEILYILHILSLDFHTLQQVNEHKKNDLYSFVVFHYY